MKYNENSVFSQKISIVYVTLKCSLEIRENWNERNIPFRQGP